MGILTSEDPDPEQPPPATHCQGGIENDPLPGVCLFQARGNQVYGTVFSHDKLRRPGPLVSATSRPPVIIATYRPAS